MFVCNVMVIYVWHSHYLDMNLQQESVKYFYANVWFSKMYVLGVSNYKYIYKYINTLRANDNYICSIFFEKSITSLYDNIKYHLLFKDNLPDMQSRNHRVLSKFTYLEMR